MAGKYSPEKYQANREKELARNRDWNTKNPEKRRACNRFSKTKSRYGVARQQWEEMWQRQGGVCAVCKKAVERPCVDHCHETERVRGLLCKPCNFMIGLAKNDPDVLQNAIDYLMRHTEEGINGPKARLQKQNTPGE